MKPIIAIVGRPNVGKSTLFNKIAGKRVSIVEDTPGVTRDRIYYEVEWNGRELIIVDTGGIEPKTDSQMLKYMRRQAEIAVENSDVIVFICDIEAGLTADDVQIARMLQKAKKNCAAFYNTEFIQADITALDFPGSSFDKVVAGNVIHLLDDPMTALQELDRVCKDGGMLIIPTYMNKNDKGKPSGFSSTVGKAGADFKREFTVGSYKQFFLDAGYRDVKITLANGRIPCAVAVMRK